jgi:hypothetical protein
MKRNVYATKSKEKLDKINVLCIIDSEDEGSGFADKEAEVDQQENRTSTLRHLEACN